MRHKPRISLPLKRMGRPLPTFTFQMFSSGVAYFEPPLILSLSRPEIVNKHKAIASSVKQRLDLVNTATLSNINWSYWLQKGTTRKMGYILFTYVNGEVGRGVWSSGPIASLGSVDWRSVQPMTEVCSWKNVTTTQRFPPSTFRLRNSRFIPCLANNAS